MVREWYVTRAITSVKAMHTVLPKLTAEEIEAALALEYASARRLVIIERLIKRAAALAAAQTTRKLTEKFSCAKHLPS